MGHKGFSNRAKSGQQAVPDRLRRVKDRAGASERRVIRSERPSRHGFRGVGPGHVDESATMRARQEDRVGDSEVSVDAYAGFKGEETPRRFVVGSHAVEVVDVTERWTTPDYAHYRVLGQDGRRYLLRYDLSSKRWELVDHDP